MLDAANKLKEICGDTEELEKTKGSALTKSPNKKKLSDKAI